MYRNNGKESLVYVGSSPTTSANKEFFENVKWKFKSKQTNKRYPMYVCMYMFRNERHFCKKCCRNFEFV